MRIRNLKNAKDIINNSDLIVSEYHKIFDNDNPIHLEIGMGKGDFLLESALRNPNINYIGVERYDTIVAKALEKIEPFHLNNIKIIKCDAKEVGDIINKEIDILYLNFFDPWPKKKHHKRRLTHPIFLNIYDKLFKADKVIILKTDNIELFDYSIEMLKEYGYKIEEISRDLENSNIPNIKTEYERKFIAKGIKINYLKVRK